MREQLYKVFVEDLIIKALALVAAAILVIVVRTELEASTTLFVHVAYTEPQGRVMISEQQPEQVRVVVRGPWGRINRAGEAAVEPIHIDLSNYSDGEMRFSPEMLRLPEGLRVESFVPPSLYLHYEPEVKLALPVQVTIEGEPADGYRFRQATPVPKLVRIRGAQNVLENMRNVLTKPLNIANFTGSASVNVDLVPPPKHTSFMDNPPPKISAEVVVELVEKKFANVPIRPTGNEQNIKISPQTATIVLRGQDLDKLQEIPVLMLDTSAEERKPAGVTYRKRPQVVNLPPGIAYEVSPGQVEFTVLKTEPVKEPGRKP